MKPTTWLSNDKIRNYGRGKVSPDDLQNSWAMLHTSDGYKVFRGSKCLGAMLSYAVEHGLGVTFPQSYKMRVRFVPKAVG